MQSPSVSGKSLVSCSFSCWAQGHPRGGAELWEVCPLGSMGPWHKEVSGHWVGPQCFLPFPQDEEEMCTGIYIAKWFLQCFIDRVRPPRETCSLTCSLPLGPREGQPQSCPPEEPGPTLGG